MDQIAISSLFFVSGLWMMLFAIIFAVINRDKRNYTLQQHKKEMERFNNNLERMVDIMELEKKHFNYRWERDRK